LWCDQFAWLEIAGVLLGSLETRREQERDEEINRDEQGDETADQILRMTQDILRFMRRRKAGLTRRSRLDVLVAGGIGSHEHLAGSPVEQRDCDETDGGAKQNKVEHSGHSYGSVVDS